MRVYLLVVAIAAVFLVVPSSWAQSGPYDLVIRNGRAIDPDSQLDAVRSIVKNGGYDKVTHILEGADTRNGTTVRALGTITDDEPRISINNVSLAERGNGQTTLFAFTVTLSAAYDQPVTMSFQTVNGTATTGDNDYIAKAGTLTFAPGETTKTITITVKGDSKKESHETFYLDLSDLSSNGLFTKSRGVGTILNDD